MAQAASGIIDAHVHAWDAVAVRHSWLDALPHLPRRAGLPTGDARRAAGVIGMVLVEAGADAHHEVAEREGMLRLAHDASTGVLGIISPSGLDVGSEGTPVPKAVLGTRVSVRDVEHEHAVGLIGRALRRADAAAWAVDVLCSAAGLAAVATAARRGPIRPLVIDHLGDPPASSTWGDPRVRAWRDALRDLVDVPNVVIKISGLRPGGVGRECARWVVEQFGTRRCMLGSDWPVSESRAYGTCFDEVADAIGGLDHELSQGTASRTYGI